MQTQQYSQSRLSEPTTDDRNLNLNHNISVIHPHSMQNQNAPSSATITTIQQASQFRKLKCPVPMAKLGYHNIFLRTDKAFIKKQLPAANSNRQQQKHKLDQFSKLREKYQEDIYKFAKAYGNHSFGLKTDIEKSIIDVDLPFGKPQLSKKLSQEVENKKIRVNAQKICYSAGKSFKKDVEGGYFFNNWRSYEEYYCLNAIKGQRNNLYAKLVYSVLDMNYEMAIKIIDKITGVTKSTQKRIKDSFYSKDHHYSISVRKSNAELNSLKIMIKGLMNICETVKATDEINENSELFEAFFNRQQYDIMEDNCFLQRQPKINLLSLEISQMQERYSYTNDSPYSKNYGREQKFAKHQSSYLHVQQNSEDALEKHHKSAENVSCLQGKNNNKKRKIWESFLGLSMKHKKRCVMSNIIFLINFAKKIRIQNIQNDYLKLLFCFLKNGVDQMGEVKNTKIHKEIPRSQKTNQYDLKPILQSESDLTFDFSDSESHFLSQGNQVNWQDQVDYCNLLCLLKNIKIYDRINFAVRLLPTSKKNRFVEQLYQTITYFPYLDNLLYFTKIYKEEVSKTLGDLTSYQALKQQKRKDFWNTKKRKNSQGHSRHESKFQKQKSLLKMSLQRSIQSKELTSNRMQSICQNYIDEYGDLATVAYLSYQFSCLTKFNEFYRQSLLLSFQAEELEILDSIKFKITQQSNEKRIPILKKDTFLSQVDFKHERIEEPKDKQPLQVFRRCQICTLKIGVDKKQSYIQCSKCHHGGHLDHLTRWYAFYQNCPNINCPCLCN